VLQFFASVFGNAMRMNYYFILLIPIAIGKSLNCVKDNYRQVARVGEIVIASFFTVYFLYNIYISSITGISGLDTVPYVPFWVS